MIWIENCACDVKQVEMMRLASAKDIDNALEESKQRVNGEKGVLDSVLHLYKFRKLISDYKPVERYEINLPSGSVSPECTP